MINYPLLTKVLDRKKQIKDIENESELWLHTETVLPKYVKEPKIKGAGIINFVRQILP